MEFSLLFKSLFMQAGFGIASFLSFLSGPGDTPPLPPLHPYKTIKETAPALPKTPLLPAFPEIADREEQEPEEKTEIKGISKESVKKPAAPATPSISATQEEEPPPEARPTEASTSPLTLNDSVRESVVNILCSAQNTVSPISGSGVLIDPRGIVLTNAHVAQFFLLKDYPTPGNVSCVIRGGSPARPLYKAELLFLSPSWIRDNAEQISRSNPTGTGEGDYALLRITGSVDAQKPLPASFPAISLDTSYVPEIDDAVLLAGYPAGFLGGMTIETNLYAVSSFASIIGIYTFGTNTEDLVSVGGTPVAQKGSSGGGMVNVASGKLVGIFVTSTDGATTGSRDLRAITLAHINRSLSIYSGTSLEGFLANNLGEKASLFNLTTAPTLRQMLVESIER